MERPKFEDIKTYAEFARYYWYREELQAICRRLGLEYVGEKRELNAVIEAYFDGVTVPHKAAVRRQKPTATELALDTGLLACGFNFGPRFRAFYARVTGDENFKFTADCVATVKRVKATGDADFTLGDLLDVKLGKRTYATYDRSSCEWNRFLRDFCADEINAGYSDKLKAASAYWRLLRGSDLPKIYTREFIEAHRAQAEKAL